MDTIIKKIVFILMLLFLSVVSYAQEDVTKFLGIPVDGFKPEMIQKLQAKGFTINPYSEEKNVLNGEFNGTDVYLFIGTNNNKVWRIAVLDEKLTDETNIRIRFNNLIQQFANNKRYLPQEDSTISKYIIPQNEDISYEMLINKKRYEAAFYQKTIKYDSLSAEKELLLTKDTLDEKEVEKLASLLVDILFESLESMNNKQVWFTIKKEYGKYRIVIFYENKYNEARGDDL